MRRLILLLLLCTLASSVQAQTTFYVDDTATGSNTGTSWSDAFTDLQDALAAASPGDEIRVAAGTYIPGTTADASFALPDGVALYGGFPDGGGSFDQRDVSAHETVLSGDHNGDDTGEIATILEANSVGAGTRVDGITVTRGTESALLVIDGTPSLVNVIFRANVDESTSNSGTALQVNGGRVSLVNATFEDNVAGHDGAALYVTGAGHVTAINAAFAGNETLSGNGGAVALNSDGSSLTLRQATATQNEARGQGGFLHVGSGSSATIDNSILWDNESMGGGQEIYLGGSSSVVELNHVIIQNGVTGPSAGIDGNGTVEDDGFILDADPQFVDAGNGDLRLQAASPAVDVGDAALLPVDAFDFDGDGHVVTEPISTDADLTLRLEDGAVDLGAYEHGDAPLPVELTTFTATRDEGAVRLEWTTASETNNAGFEVQAREKESAGAWEPLGFVEGAGTTSEPQSYAFTAEDLEPGTYLFRLKQIDTDGTARYSRQVEVRRALGSPYAVAAPYPNPAGGQATLELTVREAQHVEVALYDALGRRVATLYDDELPGNRTERIHLDGQRLSSGLYLVRAVGEDFAATRRVTIVR